VHAGNLAPSNARTIFKHFKQFAFTLPTLRCSFKYLFNPIAKILHFTVKQDSISYY
jgi:hypothetical protein